ncbi:MAG: hypothetical protein Q9162_007822 [Coniocarpon cinnabarinum]
MEPDDYTIGWICALGKTELPAAAAMLDSEHPRLPQDREDHNVYTLGEIAGHNIAIACLPAGRYGIGAAAVAAQNMQCTFKSLRFGLMVGIGGGLPSDSHDIRLGDIVVSEPTGPYGGVVQYDLGKALPKGGFEIKGQLDSPPTALLNAVSALQARHKRKGPELAIHLAKMLADNPKMRAEFGCPGAEYDVLYEYPKEELSRVVDNGQQSRVKKREIRESEGPKVHYGLIATGNKVIKDPKEVLRVKETIRSTADVLCFEMEAAGLMNDFHCIVVRGISDYADEYKNDQWQGYAAATAAAYAKELLGVISVLDTAAEHPQVMPQEVPTQGSNHFGSTHAVGSRINQGNFSNSNLQ